MMAYAMVASSCQNITMPVRIFLGLLLLSAVHSAAGAELAGLWAQYDDDGKLSSMVRISAHRSAYDGVVEWVIPGPDEPAEPLCESCMGELHNRPVAGLRILSGMKRKDALVFDGGEILDPNEGKTYRCRMTLSPDSNTLEVLGYLGVAFFGRTQTWKRKE